MCTVDNGKCTNGGNTYSKFVSIREAVSILDNNSFKLLVRLRENPSNNLLKYVYESTLKHLAEAKKSMSDNTEFDPSDCLSIISKVQEAVMVNTSPDDREYINNRFQIARSKCCVEPGSTWLTLNELDLPMIHYGGPITILSESDLDSLERQYNSSYDSADEKK